MLRTYTLSEIRNGTGWSKDVRFAEVIDARLELKGNPVFTELLEALDGIISIGKRDLTNEKYDGYFESARAAIRAAKGENK